MFHYSRLRVWSLIGVVLLAVVLALPNLLNPLGYPILTDQFGIKPMTLGLDLQGGSNILMEVDRKDLREKVKQQLMGDIRTTLRAEKIGYSGLVKLDNGVSVTLNKPEDLTRATDAFNKLLQPLEAGVLSVGTAVNLFAVKPEGQKFTFAIEEKGFDAKIASALTRAMHVIEQRINGLGTTESSIHQQGTDRVAIQIPGLQDPERVKDLLGSTAKLTFQLMCAEQPSAAAALPPPECAAYPAKKSVSMALEEKKKTTPDVKTLTADELKDLPQLWVQIAGNATVEGADLTDAQGTFGENNEPVVSFKFNQKGAVRFGKLTADNVGKPFAILLDGIIQSYPTINSPILGGSGQISGQFTTEETNNLAITLRSGALPAKLTIVEERTVGPSLGADSIKAGVYAALIGLVLVMGFMFLPYGFFGLIANIALLINLIALIAIMSVFGFTLTLPGIAGIVLTLGMAVDSNVLIYERIREEWREGKKAMPAIESGFKAALGTVTDANVTTLIAGFVLFGVGSGPVRGFAVTLAIGIFTTMFTAFSMTRLMVAAWVRWKRPKEINL